VLARREGSAWFVGGINGERTGRHLSVPLAFLPQGRYAMTLIADGDNPRTFRDQKAEVKGGDSVSVDVLPCGGFVMEIKPVQ